MRPGSSIRIVAGAARGRTLLVPRGADTRPTTDKVRGAIFNVLGQFFEGGAVLDLYAGTGALALEALSRGMDRGVCVEAGSAAAQCIRRNAELCRLADRLDVVHEKVERALPRLPDGEFALVFLDPPYALGPETALAALRPVLAPAAVVVAEHDVRAPPAERQGELALIDRRAYGGTGVSIYKL